MDTERYQALMDAAKILERAMEQAEDRDALLVLTHAIDYGMDEVFRAQEVAQ